MAYKQPSPQVVVEGGTGLSTITDHGILLGSGTGAITPLGVATNGQIPIGSTGVDPVLATLTGDDGITVTNGAGSITLAGKVVQIQSSNKIAGSGTTSSTLVDVTSASLSITPTSSSNSILVLFNWLSEHGNISGTNFDVYYAVLRGSTEISTTDKIWTTGKSTSGGDQHNGTQTYSYIDSPATTSSTTYKLQHRITTSGSTATLTTSEINIVLMEIVT
jgi:hypothetical protein